MKKRLTILCLALLPMLVAGKPIVSSNADRRSEKVAKPVVNVSWLRVENMEQPLSIDTSTPRFSWLIQSDKQDVRQTAYQIVEIGRASCRERV